MDAPPCSPSFSPSFQIIVVPPEEDQEDEYLVFHASDIPEPDLSTPPDIHSLNSALDRFHQSDSHPPPFNRAAADTIVMPRKGIDVRSIADILMSDEPPQCGEDTIIREDSEIVEVVKVRRNATPSIAARDDDLDPPTKRSKTLRSRASKAFRSIKNIGRGSVRSSKPYAQDMFASSESTHSTFAHQEVPIPPTTQARRITRRGSVVLSQLFRSPSLFDLSSPRSSSPTPTEHPNAIVSDIYQDEEDMLDRTSLHTRVASPTPSTQTFSSTARRRFSVLSLHRLFTFSSDSASSVPPPNMSRGPSGPSTASSSGPTTPTEEFTPLPLGRKGSFAPALAPNEDLSFGEMQLDSLHFDSLSFDPDHF